MTQYAHEMVMVEVMVKETDLMMMHDLWADMEEWMWNDERRKKKVIRYELFGMHGVSSVKNTSMSSLFRCVLTHEYSHIC